MKQVINVDAYCPPVGSGGVSLPYPSFWREMGCSSSNMTFRYRFGDFLIADSQPKISDTKMAVSLDEHIGQLQIPMENVGSVECCHAKHLQGKSERSVAALIETNHLCTIEVGHLQRHLATGLVPKKLMQVSTWAIGL